jgi:hypothetical protein
MFRYEVGLQCSVLSGGDAVHVHVFRTAMHFTRSRRGRLDRLNVDACLEVASVSSSRLLMVHINLAPARVRRALHGFLVWKEQIGVHWAC